MGIIAHFWCLDHRRNRPWLTTLDDGFATATKKIRVTRVPKSTIEKLIDRSIGSWVN
jgi:hypothetical protein